MLNGNAKYTLKFLLLIFLSIQFKILLQVSSKKIKYIFYLFFFFLYKQYLNKIYHIFD